MNSRHRIHDLKPPCVAIYCLLLISAPQPGDDGERNRAILSRFSAAGRPGLATLPLSIESSADSRPESRGRPGWVTSARQRSRWAAPPAVSRQWQVRVWRAGQSCDCYWKCLSRVLAAQGSIVFKMSVSLISSAGGRNSYVSFLFHSRHRFR